MSENFWRLSLHRILPLPLLLVCFFCAHCGFLPTADEGGNGNVADDAAAPVGPTRVDAMQVLAYALDEALTAFYNQNMVGRGSGFYTLAPNCPLQGTAEIRGNLALSPVAGGTSVIPDLYFYMNACGLTTTYGDLIFTTPALAYAGSSGQTLDGNVDQAISFRGTWIHDGAGLQTSADVDKSGTADVRGTIQVKGSAYEITQETECAFSLSFAQDAGSSTFTGTVCGIALVGK
jgi:hypothetical protein